MKKINPKYIALIIVIILLNSCVATRKQKDRFLSKYCERKDSISYIKKDTIIYRDSLVLFPVFENVPIYLENPCKLLCDSLGNLKPVNTTKGRSGLKSTVKSVGNVLIFECKTDSLKARIQWLERNQIITEMSHTENTVKVVCELEHKSKFDGFTYWWFWITAGILLVWILIKVARAYLKGTTGI